MLTTGAPHLRSSHPREALDDGVLKVAPPILSRVYQTLSRGFVNFLNAKKIADTRFPFPHPAVVISSVECCEFDDWLKNANLFLSSSLVPKRPAKTIFEATVQKNKSWRTSLTI